MNVPENLIPIFLFFVIGWIVWTIFSSIRRFKIARLQADVQARLLHQLDSGQNLLAYVETPAGKQFVGDLSTEKVEPSSPYRRILTRMQVGIILAVFGAALLFLRSRVNGNPEGLMIFGTLALALGIGFGLSGAMTYFLSRSFGLLDRETR
jgi:hypothetical protein